MPVLYKAAILFLLLSSTTVSAFAQDTPPNEQLLNGLLYGTAAIMVLYNLIFYLFLKQRSFLYYVLAIGCYLMFQFSIGGILYEYFSDSAPWLFQGRFRNIGPFFGALGMFWGIKFTSSFLELKQYSRRLYNLLYMALIPVAIFFTTTLFLHYRSTALVGNTTAIIWMLTILAVSSIRVFQGSIQARYFLIVHGVLILGITMHALPALGILPYTILTARSNQLGFALSSVVLSIGLAHSVHRTLEQRVTERTRLQQLVTKISTDFANADSFSIDTKIQRFLQTTGRFFETDRAYMFRLSDDLSCMENTHEWCGEDVPALKHQLQQFDLERLPWWRQQLTAKQPIKIPYIPQMPNRATEERTLLLRQGVLSLLAIPVITKDTHLIGFFGYDSIHNHRNWSESELNSLQILAHIIAHAQTKAEAERDLITAKLNAESANEAKSHFLANMTHEIRTPLNGVIGFTDLLMETNLTQQQKTYAEKANAAGHSLLELVSDILDYSKIEAGKLELESIPTDIPHLMAEAVSLVEFQANSKNLELKLDVPVSLSIHALVDPVRLRQILVNLLSNAVKFTHKGEVVLSLKAYYSSPEQVHLNFSVRDTGIGIAPEQHTSLFEPFTQADTSTTRMYGGTGLGLTISHRLAKAMGTHIEVSSQVGTGSIFSFCLKTSVPTAHL